ncbi:MAG: hypothetical protein II349_07735, partial [Akkermansia sp.]|nr:hypothetical protein [Akkermansia sp.]
QSQLSGFDGDGICANGARYGMNTHFYCLSLSSCRRHLSAPPETDAGQISIGWGMCNAPEN